MNAGGVLYTCKSSEAARKGQSSGERVSNTWIIYPEVGDNSSKEGLIPHVIVCYGRTFKGFSLLEGPAFD